MGMRGANAQKNAESECGQQARCDRQEAHAVVACAAETVVGRSVLPQPLLNPADQVLMQRWVEWSEDFRVQGLARVGGCQRAQRRFFLFAGVAVAVSGPQRIDSVVVDLLLGTASSTELLEQGVSRIHGRHAASSSRNRRASRRKRLRHA